MEGRELDIRDLAPRGEDRMLLSDQHPIERSWEACEEAGLSVEWAGEVIERRWSKASRGGVRPGNQPVGHTAFLLIGVNLGSLEEM